MADGGEAVRYRHWKNVGQGGDCVFVTTTCLDFVHAFERGDVEDAMFRFILQHCAKHEARLSAFVVMSHHVHLLLRLGDDQPATDFMREFKRRSSSLIRPMLTAESLSGFDQQRGLNGNAFWQRSFRSTLVVTERTFLQKVRYIHLNPVKAELVAEPADDPWSSAWMWQSGLWNSETGSAS